MWCYSLGKHPCFNGVCVCWGPVDCITNVQVDTCTRYVDSQTQIHSYTHNIHTHIQHAHAMFTHTHAHPHTHTTYPHTHTTYPHTNTTYRGAYRSSPSKWFHPQDMVPMGSMKHDATGEYMYTYMVLMQCSKHCSFLHTLFTVYSTHSWCSASIYHHMHSETIYTTMHIPTFNHTNITQTTPPPPLSHHIPFPTKSPPSQHRQALCVPP